MVIFHVFFVNVYQAGALPRRQEAAWWMQKASVVSLGYPEIHLPNLRKKKLRRENGTNRSKNNGQNHKLNLNIVGIYGNISCLMGISWDDSYIYIVVVYCGYKPVILLTATTVPRICWGQRLNSSSLWEGMLSCSAAQEPKMLPDDMLLSPAKVHRRKNSPRCGLPLCTVPVLDDIWATQNSYGSWLVVQ